MKNFVTSISILITTLFGSLNVASLPDGTLAQINQPLAVVEQAPKIKLAERELLLSNRHPNAGINEIFKKNILLNLAYLSGKVTSKKDINWEEITKAQTVSFILEPGKTFAFHDHVLPEYRDSLTVTTKTHFNATEGYLFSGFLYGDGVCHLASVINWVAQDAGLEIRVTKAHSIAKIPDVPDQFGVSIYTIAEQENSGTNNNLYITNNQTQSVEFRLTVVGEKLVVEVLKVPALA